MELINRVITIPGPQAIQCSKQLAQKEGIFVGISAGATFAAALEVAKDAEEGATILCMLPDTGERYLSTPLFADILAEMNEEETKISQAVGVPA
jgi:cysteine synthase A